MNGWYDRSMFVPYGTPLLAFTARGSRERANGGDPVGHIGTSNRSDRLDLSAPRWNRRASRAHYRAACGAVLGGDRAAPGTVFDPKHPRACPKCVKARGLDRA